MTIDHTNAYNHQMERLLALPPSTGKNRAIAELKKYPPLDIGPLRAKVGFSAFHNTRSWLFTYNDLEEIQLCTSNMDQAFLLGFLKGFRAFLKAQRENSQDIEICVNFVGSVLTENSDFNYAELEDEIHHNL